MRKRVAANPKKQVPGQKRKDRLKDQSVERGLLKIDTLWARVGVQVTP